MRGMRALAGAVATMAAVALAGLLAGCGSGGSDGPGGSGDDGRPAIVVTTPVLAALVSELAGERAEVTALMPNGADPHEYAPSAREVARMLDADLVVENGLALEEGLSRALEQARDAGVPVFTATDHVELREAGAAPAPASRPADGDAGGGHADDEHADDEHAHEERAGDVHGGDEGSPGGAPGEAHAEDDHGHEGDDPHIWMDPLAMRAAMLALADELRATLGLDVADGSAALAERLERLDARVRDILAPVPPAERRLVSGHESMGYFADRYRFEVVGFLLPSLSSQAGVSAGNLAALRSRVEAEGVRVILDETGTPAGVADAIARETGARVVRVGTHTLPEDGSYETFITDIARTLAGAYAAG